MANSIEEEDRRISVGEISEASSIENLGWDLYNDNSDETNNESSIMNDDNDNEEEPPRISNVSTFSGGEDLGWDLYDGDDDDDEKIREPPTSGGIEVMDDDDDEPRPLCYTHDNDVVETGEGKKKMAGIEVVNDSDDATPTFVASVDVSPGYDITSTFSETSHSKSNETPKDYDEENTIVHANNSSGSNHHLSRKERKAHKDEQEVVAATYSAAVAKRRRTIMLCSIFPLIAAAIALITLSIKDTAKSNTPEELDTNDAFDRDDLKLGNVIATVKEDTASTHSGPDEHGYLRPITTTPATSATTSISTITAEASVPAYPPLTDVVGKDKFWLFNNHDPLEQCQGDCFFDDDCEGSLVCFHRGETLSIVPGCSGQGTRGIDYCIEPLPHLVSLQKVVGNGKSFLFFEEYALGTCQGDCNCDGDCEGSLICFHREGQLKVPGCTGVGEPGTDYCIHPPHSSAIVSATTTVEETTVEENDDYDVSFSIGGEIKEKKSRSSDRSSK